MSVVNLYGVHGTLTGPLSDASTLLPVDSALSGAIVDAGFVSGTDESWLAIMSGNVFELVKLVTVSPGQLGVVRSSDPKAFPAGAIVRFELTAEAILATIGTVSTAVEISGQGLAQVTTPELNKWTVNVPAFSITGADGVEVLGAYPSFTIGYSGNDSGGCGDGGGSGGGGGGEAVVELRGGGIATAYASGGIGFVTVTKPTFNAGPGVAITGDWPVYTISASGGGGGTVESVAVGAGLTLTGSPTVNPTISMANTGVTAGQYGDITVNARGQLTAVASGFDPISTINAGTGLTVTRTGGAVTLTPVQAAIATKGIAELADEAAPLDENDNTSIVTPALLAAVLASTESSTVSGVKSFAGEADASYTNTLTSTVTPVDLEAGEMAVVFASVTCVDGTTPTTPPEIGIAVFDSQPSKVQGNKKIAQISQDLCFTITGPISTNYALVTTAVPGTASITGYSFWVMKL